jgi:hypothetical protein
VSDLPEITKALLDHIKRVAEAEGDADLPHGPEWEATITPETVLSLLREVRVRGKALGNVAGKAADCPLALGVGCVHPELPRHGEGFRRCQEMFGAGYPERGVACMCEWATAEARAAIAAEEAGK